MIKLPNSRQIIFALIYLLELLVGFLVISSTGSWLWGILFLGILGLTYPFLKKYLRWQDGRAKELWDYRREKSEKEFQARKSSEIPKLLKAEMLPGGRLAVEFANGERRYFSPALAQDYQNFAELGNQIAVSDTMSWIGNEIKIFPDGGLQINAGRIYDAETVYLRSTKHLTEL